MSDSETATESAPEENSSWSLKLDANPLDEGDSSSSPIQLFRNEENWEITDKEFIRKCANSYWRHLGATLASKLEGAHHFEITLLERLYYDWGIWCGDQFAHDEGVIEIFEDSPGANKKQVYQMVFEEVANEFGHDLKYAPNVMGVTDWLHHRDENYRVIAEAERFSITKDLFPILPEECSNYFQLMEERLEILKKLKPSIQKIPGISPSLMALLMSGSLHDELDFLKSKLRHQPDEMRRLKQFENLWNGVHKHLASIKADQEVRETVKSLDGVSERIISYCKTRRTDVEKLREMARQAYKDEKQTHKRLMREVMIIKNNLNVASMRKTFKNHFPLTLKWPNPIKKDELLAALHLIESMDNHYSDHCQFILAPGEFDGFYEFDRGSIMLPIHSGGQELKQCITAMVEHRISVEMRREGSHFIDDLKELSESPPRKHFLALYTKWIEQASKGQTQDFTPEEAEFLLKHVAPSPMHLFLRDEQLTIDAKTKASIINQAKSKSAENIHRLAAMLFTQGKVQDAFKWITQAIKIKGNHAPYEISLAVILMKLKRHDDALVVLKRWEGKESAGYIRFFVEKFIKALSR